MHVTAEYTKGAVQETKNETLGEYEPKHVQMSLSRLAHSLGKKIVEVLGDPPEIKLDCFGVFS